MGCGVKVCGVWGGDCDDDDDDDAGDDGAQCLWHCVVLSTRLLGPEIGLRHPKTLRTHEPKTRP